MNVYFLIFSDFLVYELKRRHQNDISYVTASVLLLLFYEFVIYLMLEPSS